MNNSLSLYLKESLFIHIIPRQFLSPSLSCMILLLLSYKKNFEVAQNLVNI